MTETAKNAIARLRTEVRWYDTWSSNTTRFPFGIPRTSKVKQHAVMQGLLSLIPGALESVEDEKGGFHLKQEKITEQKSFLWFRWTVEKTEDYCTTIRRIADKVLAMPIYDDPDWL